MKCSLDISNSLKISSLSHPIVFLYFFALFISGLLISPCYSLELCIQFDISFPFSLAFHFLSFLLFLKSLLKPLGLLGKSLCYTKAVSHEGKLCEWFCIKWNRGNDSSDVSLFCSASITVTVVFIVP